MNLSDEFDISWMEDTLQLIGGNEPVPAPLVVEEEDCSFKGNQPACVNLVNETKSAFLRDCQHNANSLGSPESFTEEDMEDDDDKWQDEFSQLVESSEREVPVLDERTQKELVELPVKEFNIRTKSLKLDAKVLQHLKLCRKRLKNRQAAIRSRSKKETETTFLRNKVDELTREKEKQRELIDQLQKRLAEMEKKMKSS